MTEMRISDLCSVVRSKQAGPFRLCLDLLFKSAEAYRQARESGALTPCVIAELYQVPECHITDFVFYDPGSAVKITLVRPRVAGDIGDGDVYGCQQHVPLLGLRLKIAGARETR